MKKPVKPTPAMIDEKVAKLKDRDVSLYKALPSGTITKFIEAVNEFATKNGVDPLTVKIQGGYYGSLRAKRPETQAEKRKRVAADMNERYRVQKRNYDYWLKEQERERAQAEAVLRRQNALNAPTHKVTVKCCCNCKCK